MNPYIAIPLFIWLAGAAVFLLLWRDRVLGGWFQALVSALCWPILLVVLLTKKDLP